MFEVNPNAFYTLADLSVGLNITLASLRSWIRRGKLKASKIGRNYMVSGQDLKYFLENGIKSNP